LIKKTFGLAACGAMAALAAAGCSSGSSGSPATAGKGADPASATATASPKATAPAWAKTLGPGVTVTDSRTAKAGGGSPAGVFQSLLKDVQTENFSRICALYEPSLQSECKSQTGSISTAEYKSGMPTFKDRAPSYSGKPFSTLWQAPTADSNSNQSAYALARLIRVNGTWYPYATSM